MENKFYRNIFNRRMRFTKKNLKSDRAGRGELRATPTLGWVTYTCTRLEVRQRTDSVVVVPSKMPDTRTYTPERPLRGGWSLFPPRLAAVATVRDGLFSRCFSSSLSVVPGARTKGVNETGCILMHPHLRHS